MNKSDHKPFFSESFTPFGGWGDKKQLGSCTIWDYLIWFVLKFLFLIIIKLPRHQQAGDKTNLIVYQYFK